MSGISVRGRGEEGVLVELRGELDQYDLEDLRGTFGGVVQLRRPTLVDLSRITFLDVGCARELALISQLYGRHLTLCNPSWQVRASVSVCGLELWLTCGTNDPDYCRAS
ncbi:MAG: STAS domain-containing protein [Actinomycetota bacterium]|nr:STAS domain-containing protein [Actinomycetota bacterium]